jgi:catechol 2,3-dioxygenase-like lactoylglutathione lyase family enzyme
MVGAPRRQGDDRRRHGRSSWSIDGGEAAETSALAIQLILEAARERSRHPDPNQSETPDALTRGLNHVAVVTEDLDRFVEFYTEVFDVEVVFTETTSAFRHAIVRFGPDSSLHPAEATGDRHGTAQPAMFGRGHLDHLAVAADSLDAFHELRHRLVARSASDGTIVDLGAFHSLWFTDPDDMRGEVTLIVNTDLAGIHAPTPLPSR